MLRSNYFILVITLLTFTACTQNEDHKKDESINYNSWPSEETWATLKEQLQDRLISLNSPYEPCKESTDNAKCQQLFKNLQNPYYIEDNPNLTQSVGYYDAWEAQVSPYAVVAETPEDIIAAVNFARKNHVKLVIKGTGHDYIGRSNAKNSLLIWTHKMRDITLHDSFIPQGAPESTKGVPAVSAEAGARWIEAYTKVTTENGRYVQGGGCTSVGVAGGFLQGGGFGSWSKKYGTGAANVLEFEVVTADGKLLTANEFQNPDLFWALRGGGGSTFGVVTKVTLLTHELPEYFGRVTGDITANSDESYLALIERFVNFYRESLSNEYWGEQANFNPDNKLNLSFTFQGLNKSEAESVWQPFRKWVNQHSKDYTMNIDVTAVPAQKVWDKSYWEKEDPSFITLDNRRTDSSGFYWWTPNSNEVSIYWYTYQSRYIPEHLFAKSNAKNFANVLYNASRESSYAIHFNKGQADAAKDAIERGKNTSVNPNIYKSVGLLIMAEGVQHSFPAIPDHEINDKEAQEKIKKVNAGMKHIKDATPNSGSYDNEGDYFEKDWQKEFWGSNYPKLLEIKNKYDPTRLFNTHHGVGSEAGVN